MLGEGFSHRCQLCAEVVGQIRFNFRLQAGKDGLRSPIHRPVGQGCSREQPFYLGASGDGHHRQQQDYDEETEANRQTRPGGVRWGGNKQPSQGMV